MPKYQVVLYYHGSATFDGVEAADEAAAIEEAQRLGNEEPEEAFRLERLILDYTDAAVCEDKEE